MWDKYLTDLNTIWDLEMLHRQTSQSEEASGFHTSLWDQHLATLNQDWHVVSTFTLEPPTSLPGKLLFPLKKMVLRWVRPVFEAIIQRQNDVNARLVQTCNALVETTEAEAIQRLEAQKTFNSRLVQTLNGLVDLLAFDFSRLRQEYEERLHALRLEFEELHTMVWTFERRKEALEIDEILLNQKLERILSMLHSPSSEERREQMQHNPSSDRQMDYAYVLFEHQYRGDEATLKQRQSAYLQYFEGCVNVLDIGCGRGEFLELLQEHGISGYGLDLNQAMLAYCHKKGLTVEEADSVAHLQTLKDNSLGGIFIAQMVEHCDPPQLSQLLQLCFQKLQPQKYLIVETQNPTSLYALSHFYRDLSHEKPIHPDALMFLAKTAGFTEVQVTYTAPFPKEHVLQKLEDIATDDGVLRENITRLNQNICQLNALLYGYLDYAVIAKKLTSL
jgi:O-antigen chain-terminating methyltransferase